MYHEPIIAGESLSELVQIAGLVRFSYPCEGGFQRKHASRAAQAAYLYAPARMEERFRFFEALCLHSLKAQTDKGFTVGVLIGEDMPAQYRTRLEGLLAGLPQVSLIALPYMPYAEAMQRAFTRLFNGHAPLHLSFRLDDDDAVAVDFIAEVRARLPQIFGMSGGLDPAGLSFLQGLTLIKGEIVPSVDARPLGLGLCVMAPAGREITALRFEHQKLHQYMPVLMDPHPLMNLRAFHGSNDSPVVLPAGRRPEMSTAEIRDVLQRRFALDMDEVLAL
ncbi:MAG: hypothetical protein COB08_011390 [Rhodobacteraceae bacterium]|nr:hypothetical protein [Paracoccaceae bacterium]